jgi:ubiquinone/menaquinone biosynthesis C-methylase UbiE
MNKERIAGIFDRAAATYDQIGPQPFLFYGRRLVELSYIPHGAHILDVATGRGALLFPAATQVGVHGYVVGLDLSTGMLHQIATECRHLGLRNFALCQGDANHLPFQEATFDFVLCGHSIFFFPQAVREFYRVLRPPGGVGLTIISRGCFDWLWEAFAAYGPARNPPANTQDAAADDLALDTAVGLNALLHEASFTKIQVIEEERDFLYADEHVWWSLMWTLGFRSMMEQMEPTTLEEFQADIFRRLLACKKSDGIHIRFRVLFAFGYKSG